MAGEAEFHKGNVSAQTSYTPSGAAVAAGQVVLINQIPYVAHRPIADGELGSLAVSGGTYRMISDGTLDTPGSTAYWDDTAKKITATAATNYPFGFTGPSVAANADGDVIEVEHRPSGIVGV